jgi:exonuclease III
MTPTSLRISAWNANGLTNHIQEIILHLNINKIDILLISETHAIDRTYAKIPYYIVYFANHLDNHAHAGAAIIIRTALQHYILQPYTKTQSAIVKIQLSHRPVMIAAIYSPPRHSISSKDYEEYLSSLGPQFTVAGDWNAKHTTWGSRLTATKGTNLLCTMTQLNINFLSTGEPTYWPTDRNRTPDLLDFALMKGIPDIVYIRKYKET